MNVYASRDAQESPREIAHRELAREAARDGMVLLHNDALLPLTPQRIGLFGSGARRTIIGGTGSGDVNVRRIVSVEEGLIEAGFEVTSTAYLDEFDALRDQSYAEFRSTVKAAIAPIEDPEQALVATFGYHYQVPSPRPVSAADVEATDAQVAIYVLSRLAGEGADRRDEPGDFRLTDSEVSDLTLLARHFPGVALIINVGGLIDLSPLDDLPEIRAIVQAGQGGMAMGSALAELLTGRADFTGRLTDTWPASYADVPFGDRFGADPVAERYHEDLYVGYRYVVSADVTPRYPFGHGLSYSTFDLRPGRARLDGTSLTVPVHVTNTGSLISRQVVQAYAAPSGGRLPKPALALVAFAKGPALNPGASASIDLSFDVRDLCCWDPASAAWVLDAGEYELRVGISSADTAAVAVLRIPAEVAVCRAATKLAPREDLELLSLPERAGRPTPGVDVLELDPAAVPTRTVSYDPPVGPEPNAVAALLDTLSTEEQAELLIGAHPFLQTPGAHPLIGSGGLTTTSLLGRGVPNVMLLDGPAGLHLMPTHLRRTADGELLAAELPAKYDWGGATAELPDRRIAADGEDFWRWATGWPVATVLAQTWDTDLLERVGHAVGTEMVEFGVTAWLAPGLNLHRNPLCGRNFEYFSEDPLVSGRCAAALTRGVQAHRGLTVTIKHFVANNREDHRTQCDSIVSERALRELYLRGFEIAVRESDPGAVMSSYNLVNGTYTPNSTELLTDVLRCEWGFSGLVMSDWGACSPDAGDAALAVPAGNDLLMPGNPGVRDRLREAVTCGDVPAEAVRRSAARVLSLVLDGAARLG